MSAKPKIAGTVPRGTQNEWENGEKERENGGNEVRRDGSTYRRIKFSWSARTEKQTNIPKSGSVTLQSEALLRSWVTELEGTKR